MCSFELPAWYHHYMLATVPTARSWFAGAAERVSGRSVGTITKSVEIDRPASEVWSVLEDVRRLPDFSPNTEAVRDAPERITDPGQTFRQVVKLLGKRFESDWVVTDVEPGRLLAIEGSVGYGAHYCLREDVEPIDDG